MYISYTWQCSYDRDLVVASVQWFEKKIWVWGKKWVNESVHGYTHRYRYIYAQLYTQHWACMCICLIRDNVRMIGIFLLLLHWAFREENLGLGLKMGEVLLLAAACKGWRRKGVGESSREVWGFFCCCVVLFRLYCIFLVLLMAVDGSGRRQLSYLRGIWL